MRVDVTTFWFPKAGATAAEYEDAFVPGDGERHGDRLSFAVADGATEGMLSGSWARLLTEVFVGVLDSSPALHRGPSILGRARQAWPEIVERYSRTRDERGEPLRWYEAEKLDQGSFATLLALQLRGGSPSFFRVHAVGDACLFHVRSGRHLWSFPLSRAAEFGSTPDLITTTGPVPKFRTVTQQFMGDDSFYLCSDAAAHWILSSIEVGNDPFGEIDQLDRKDLQEREEWLDSLRLKREMRNDDVTIMRVTVFATE